MALTFKAFLYERTWRGDPVEIRRFTIDQDVSSSYAYLVQKVVQVFPSLKADNFNLAWTDADRDIITISSDEELVEALDQFEGNIFRLLLKKRPSAAAATSTIPPTSQGNPQGVDSQDPPTDNPSSTRGETQGSFHPGIQCDGCSGPIYGTRFKCLVCRDYDLCSGCEGKGMHVDHNMMSISDPWSYRPWGFPHCPRGRCGPFRGRGGCRGGHFGGHPYAGGSGGQGFFAPWWQGFEMGGANCHGNQWFNPQKKADKSEGQEPMDTEQKPGPSEEERKTFLRGVGEAVSSFLEPFGVKVDVDVLGGEKPGDSKSASEAAAPADQKEDEVIEEALAQLRSMGYQDEGGWLIELVRAKGGDVAKVLDALHPSVDQD